MSDLGEPTWRDFRALPRAERASIYRMGQSGALPADPRTADIAVVWAREWPRHGLTRALLVIAVAVVNLVATMPPLLHVLLWVWVATMVVGFAIVLHARRGILTAERARAQAQAAQLAE